MERWHIYKTVFFAAAAYNICWGIFTAWFPSAFFDFAGMHQPLYPEIHACLGMVVGLYGLLYYWVALKLHEAWPIVAIGLIGKIFGPLGMLGLVASGSWPLKACVLVVFNDLIWVPPFRSFYSKEELSDGEVRLM